MTISNTTLLFGLKIWRETKTTLLADLAEFLHNTSSTSLLWMICTPNSEQIMLAEKDAEFRSVLTQSTINIPDGMGLVLASKILHPNSKRITQRISGRELMNDLIALAAKQKLSVFLLGGADKTALRLSKKIQKHFPTLQIFTSSGASTIASETPEQRAQVLEEIKQKKPTMLFIAYGAPFQETWIYKNTQELSAAGVKIAMGVGGAFDIELEMIPPAPSKIEKTGLEWLWRLVHQPWRWKRQTALLRFGIKVIRQSFI